MDRTRAHAKLPDVRTPVLGDADAIAEGRERTLAGRAYRQIREMLLDGRLAEGARISELSLAEQLGCSRAPVREAVRRLRNERIVEQVHRVGTMVRSPDAAEWLAVYGLREALEVWVAREAAARGISAEADDRLRGTCDAMLISARRLALGPAPAEARKICAASMDADLAMHHTLRDAVDNPAVSRSMREMDMFATTFSRRRDQVVEAVGIVRIWIAHRRIVNAVRRRDPDAAAAYMRAHVHASRDVALRRFEQAERAPAVAASA